jgi:phosphoglycolate phosphatase
MAALQRALGEVFGVAGSIEGIDFAGRTDPWIIRQIFARFGIPDTARNHTRYVDAYIGLLPEVLAQKQARVLPGVKTLLDQAAAHSGIVQGLLTGNLRRGAQTKLGFHGLWDYFPIGAFADDSEVRNDLGPHALGRARTHWGLEFAPEKVWIVGDTPHDIACARAFGARALAVATGSSTSAILLNHKPDAVLEDLGDSDAFWRVLGA